MVIECIASIGSHLAKKKIVFNPYDCYDYLGSIWTDFKPQVAGLDRNKFTIVAWDPPGYGNSRPPNRNFGNDFFYRDASLSHDFMKKIGFHQFSIIGWSDGGITSLLLASKYPESIKKMIIVGANAYILPEEIETYKSRFNLPEKTIFLIPNS